MAGPRYEDWHHLRVEGDQAAARQLIPLARKVLGYAVQEARRNGLQTFKHVHKTPDGGQIVGEINGGIPRVSIFAPGARGKQDRRTVEGFVLTWGGVTEGWDPVILREPPVPFGEEGWKDWRSMFFSSSSLGYAETPGDRRAGSYMDVFGIKAKAPSDSRLLPANGLWAHRDTGEAVAWFRGYTGYWPEHYRHPRVNYGNWVTIYGHVVLLLGGGWRVMAAAMRDGWLYLMVGEDLGVMNPPAVPGAPSYSGQVWCSQPYSNDLFTYSLWRMPLRVETQPDTLVESYTVDAAGAEMLWRAAIRRAYGAWSFNADCSEVVTVQLPRLAVYSWVYENDGTDWIPSSVEDSSFPTIEANRVAIALNHSVDGAPVATFSATLAPNLIAEEDGVQLEIVEHTRPFPGGAYGRNDYRIGDFTIPVTEQVVAGGVRWYERRVMLYAHLPSKTLLLHRWRTSIEPGRSVSAGFQLFVDGEEVAIDDPSAVESGFGAGTFDTVSASNHFRMMGVGYDDGAGTSWYRPMDAMSFLLGFGFSVQAAVPSTGSPAEPGYGYQGCPHYGYTFSPLNHSEHTAAGGYVFGSVGGDSGFFWGWSFTLAEPYGANNGSYTDGAPSSTPTTNYIGAGATYGENTLAAVGMQPLLGVAVGGASPFATLANQNRYIHLGTNGDAATLLEAATVAAGGAPWRRFTLGHTGAPRPGQKRIIHGR